ncbi:hypothetical protein [Streptomyces sp. NPDC096339]|uniref:hypothetical protein n=1 Tax=Streptomyces sp. NPDC096339 TaxID=3366086 RepID=UPI0037FCC50F
MYDEELTRISPRARILNVVGVGGIGKTRAEALMAQAKDEYRTAEAVIGLANIRTNQAELLVVTDPEAAVQEAGVALEVQRELGAQHEIGKVYTAMGTAQIRLGQLDRAELSLANANAALDRAGYRSGRARADTFRAFLHLRRGDGQATRELLRHVAREFEECEVHPSLILAIHRASERIGPADPEIAAAAERARPSLRVLGTAEDLERRTEEVLSMFIEVNS